MVQDSNFTNDVGMKRLFYFSFKKKSTAIFAGNIFSDASSLSIIVEKATAKIFIKISYQQLVGLLAISSPTLKSEIKKRV